MPDTTTEPVRVITRDLPPLYFTKGWRYGDNIKYLLGSVRGNVFMLVFDGNKKLHAEWRDRMRFDNMISAGMVIEGNPFRCYGEATSMDGLRARQEEDTAILLQWLSEEDR